MPIEAPPRTVTPTSTKTPSDFVLCENFAFRPASVDGFLHEIYADGSAVTTVNFKSYTQSVRDPHRKLFDLLVEKLRPHSPDENA